MRRDVKRCSAITLSCLWMCEFVPSFVLAFGNFTGHIYRYIGIMGNILPQPMPHLPATSFCFWFGNTGGRGGYSAGSFTYSSKSAGWQSSIAQILSIFCKAIYFPWRSDWMTPSDNSASFHNLLVLYPASFNASRIFILYRIKASPPLLLDALFHYPHYSIELHRNQCKK